MPARTGDTSLKLTFLNCQHLSWSPSLSQPTSRIVSLYRSHFVSPSAFLHIDFDTWQSFIVVVVVAAVNMSSWLVCPTSLTASQPGPWTMSWVDLPHEQYAARKAQRATVSVKRVATATKTAMKCTHTHSTKYIHTYVQTHACTQNIFVCVIHIHAYMFCCYCSCHVGVAINKPALLCGMLCDAKKSQTKASNSYYFCISLLFCNVKWMTLLYVRFMLL